MMHLLPLSLGVVVLAAAWSGVAARLAHGPFSAHMAVHMSVVAIASPLLVAAAAGGRLDPARRRPWLFAPIPASIVELVLVWAWHVPALHEAARASSSAYLAEQATFLFAGLLLWLSVAGGDRRDGAARAAAGAGALLFTSMHMTLLGALFALTPRVLYAGHHGAGPAALADQHLGGVIMLLVGGGSYLVGGLWLTARMLRHREPSLRSVEAAGQ
jgi:putative membrane protein